MESCCYHRQHTTSSQPLVDSTYGSFHPLSCNQLHTAHDVLLHLDQLREFPGQVGTESPGGVLTEGMACSTVTVSLAWPQSQHVGVNVPKPPFPSHLLVFVVDNGGGGFSTCEAVGARDWRIE